MWSLNHWPTRELPPVLFFSFLFCNKIYDYISLEIVEQHIRVWLEFESGWLWHLGSLSGLRFMGIWAQLGEIKVHCCFFFPLEIIYINKMAPRGLYFDDLMLSFLFTGVLLTQLCLTLQPHGLQPSRLLCSWNSLGKNTGVGCHCLLQGIFLTQGSNLRLPNCRQILYQLSHQGSPMIWTFIWKF